MTRLSVSPQRGARAPDRYSLGDHRSQSITRQPSSDWQSLHRAGLAPLETYRVGDRVSHDTWGLGRVIDLAEDRSLLVTFGGARTLRVTVPYRKLQKL